MYNVYPAFDTAIKQAVSRKLKSYQTSAGHKIYLLSRVFIHSFMNVTSFSQYAPLSGCKPRWTFLVQTLGSSQNVTFGGNSNWAFPATFWSLPFCHLSVKVSDSTSIPKDNHCWLKICVSKKYKSCVPYVAKGQQHSEDLVDFCQKQFPSFLFHRFYVINPIWWKADWETIWLFVWHLTSIYIATTCCDKGVGYTKRLLRKNYKRCQKYYFLSSFAPSWWETKPFIWFSCKMSNF